MKFFPIFFFDSLILFSLFNFAWKRNFERKCRSGMKEIIIMIISHVWQPTMEKQQKLSLFAGVRGFHFMRCTRKMATHGWWFLSNDFERLTIRGKATGREVIRAQAVYKKYIPVAHWQKPVNGLKGAASSVQVEWRSVTDTDFNWWISWWSESLAQWHWKRILRTAIEGRHGS